MKIIQSERKQYLKLKYNKYQKKIIIMDTVIGWAFLSPLLIVAIIFSTTAIAIGLWMTFQSGTSMAELSPVGFKNWIKVFTSSSLHLDVAFKNTFFYAIVSVPTIIIVALILSSILNASWIKGKQFFLALFFLPQITSAIAVTLIFKQLFSPTGLIKIDYWSDPTKIIWVVIISAIWGGVAGSLITFNTAFATIDKTQYEAADLDGANGFSKFINITIPSIGPIIAYSLIMGIIGGLGVFDGPYLLAATANIPPNSVMTLMLKGFWLIRPLSAQGAYNMGLGTAILFLTAMIMALATIIANAFMPMSRKTN